jgi:hypothetical protein
MNAYTRENPSERYKELLGYYQDMHKHGAVAQNIPASETFDGRSLPGHATIIRDLIRNLGAHTILDYGSGKGRQYDAMSIEHNDGKSYPDIPTFWGIDSLTCYDPGYERFSELPKGTFDGVISTDVLEHIPKEDVPWVLDEIFDYARIFVYLNVACYPAKKMLPNGENAHCTVEPPEWWIKLFDQRVKLTPGLKYFSVFDVPIRQPDGTIEFRMVSHQG